MEKSLSKLANISISFIMAISVFACSDTKNINNTLPNHNNSLSYVKNNQNTGVLSINLSNIFSNKLTTKGSFNDTKIKQIKIEVFAVDITDKIIRNVDWLGGTLNQTVNIDIPQGKNRVVSVTGVDAIGQPIARLMTVTDIYANTTSTAIINYGTTAVARILNNILDSNNRAVAGKIDIERLKRLVSNLTNYRESDSTFFGVDPTKIDVFSISDRIISNDGYIDPDNTTDLKNNLDYGNLKVYVKDKSGNAIMSNVNLAINDISGKAITPQNNYNKMQVDQGIWEVSAKVYINSNGTTINFPLNTTDERNLILNGGGILYAKQRVIVKGTQEQEVTLNLSNLKVKEVQFFKDEKKLDSYQNEINNPQDIDARVIYEDDSYSRDQVIWELGDNSVATVTPSGMLTGLKRSSTSLKATSILNKDKSLSISVNFTDPGLAPIINSFTGGPTGVLTIYGKNFDDQVPINNIVKINGYKADVIEVTTDYIKVTIPNNGAVGIGRITVENLNGSKISDNIFNGNPIQTTGGVTITPPNNGFIQGSLNAIQMGAINDFLTELTREQRINQILANPTAVYPGLASTNVAVSTLTSAQIKFISDYIFQTSFATDVANAATGTTLGQLLNNTTKYYNQENLINALCIDNSSVLIKDMNTRLVNYVLSKLPTVDATTFRADVAAAKDTDSLSTILANVKYVAQKTEIDNYLKDLKGQIKDVPSFSVLVTSLTDLQIQSIVNFTGLDYQTIKNDVEAEKLLDKTNLTPSKKKLINLFSSDKYHQPNINLTNLLNNSNTVDTPLTSTMDVRNVTSPQLDFLASYLSLNKTSLGNDMTFSTKGTNLNQFFSASKYHGADNVGLNTTTTVNGINAAIKTYISNMTKISTAVLDIAVPNLTQTDTVFKSFQDLKDYATNNSVIYGPSEGPMVAINLSQFSMDSTEVSNADFKKFMDADGYNKREYWDDAGWNWKIANNINQPLYWNDSKYNQDNQPVVGVSWYEAYAYSKWVGKRLPTESEWELSSKGSSTTQFPWNNKLYPWGNTKPDQNTTLANGFFGSDGSADGFKFTAPVVSFTTNNISNLSGNVMEWVNDWYDYGYYGRTSDFTNPKGPVNGTFKIVRGGAWNHSKDELRASYRELYLKPESRNLNLGFRCVK
ncbi:MAG: SUMF1/EgtB/PvdO family nonheme iron enzyme [Candidatus Sericytochromatia bacterium]